MSAWEQARGWAWIGLGCLAVVLGAAADLGRWFA